MASSLPTRSRKYSEEEIDTSLLTIAACAGNVQRAGRLLASRGIRVPSRTLYDWRNRLYPERYIQLANEHGREIEAVAVQSMREIILMAGEVERRGMEKSLEQLEEGTAKDPSTIMRNASVTKGINTQHLLTLTDRPTEIVETRNPDWYVRELVRLGVVTGWPGTVDEDIPAATDATVVEDDE